MTTSPDPLHKLLKSQEVMAHLRIGRSTFYRWVDEGKINACLVNGELRVHVDELARVVREYAK